MFAASKTDSASTGGYQISRSLRFNSADSAYLNRTPASAGNKQTWTLSVWVKRGSLSAFNPIFTAGPVSPRALVLLQSDNKLQVRQVDSTDTEVIKLVTTQVFRDPSAWYHIVVAQDTTQATSSNRVKVYVNGTQVTAFDTATYPNQNISNLAINDALEHNYGRYVNSPSDGYLSAYLTETNFIDGQALTPSSFGETNAQTGVWQPKAYSGSYGTNGFYLNFSDNSNTTAATLGKDYSGNGNNWTPNNFSVTAGAGNDSLVDSPTSYGTDTGVGGTVRGNYSTYNPLVVSYVPPTYSNGNLDLSAAVGWNSAVGTIGINSGKWYWEVVCGNGDAFIGICGSNATLSVLNPQNSTGTISYFIQDGTKRIDGTSSSYGAAATTETIGVALDIDGGTVTFYKSNTSQGSISLSSSTLNGLTIFPFFVKYSSTMTVNFGQRPFAYTAPSGFKALCTQNLPTPTIGATTATQAGKFFAPVLYTGNSSTNNITGVGFQPDWTWIKRRDNTYSHILQNSVTGVTKYLASNLTNAEDTYSLYIQSWNSDGFTLGSGDNASNNSGSTYVAWNWKANGAGSTNTAGSITSTVSANTTSGFSVVTYTGNSAADQTIGHGLGVAPSMIIAKCRANNGTNWVIYHTSLGINQVMLFTTSAAISVSGYWGTSSPTSTVFGVKGGGYDNNPSATMVAYCFAEVAGYSKFGSYAGNGASDGPFIYTGFRPAYVMIKSTSLSQPWVVKDKLRAANYNPQDGNLYPNLSNAEDTTASVYIDLLSNGFKIRGDYAGINSGTSSYIFMAFAESPQKFSLAR